MVNVGYHSARLQAKLIRSLYTRRITQIVRTPIAQTQRVPITVYAFSCERDLPEQVSCSTSKLHFLCGRDAHPTITLSNFGCAV